MLGTSLPFHWLLAGGAPLGDVPTVLNTLKAHGVKSVELRTVNPNTDPDDVLYAANLLWDAGFVITVHAAPKSVERAVDDVFVPLTTLLDHLRQEKLTVVVHPDFNDNAALLTTLVDHRDAHGCPIVFALENNRLLPGKVDGDCAALVLDAVKNVRAAGYRDIGICFDFGHYLYYWNKLHPTEPFTLPSRDFFRHVVHTHIHTCRKPDLRTHFPLGLYDMPLAEMLGALYHGYFGVYNLELDYPRFEDIHEPFSALLTSVDTLASAMPIAARLYDSLRAEFDAKFTQAVDALHAPSTENGTYLAPLLSASYLFRTNGYLWGMDIAFRYAYHLCKTPHRLADLLGDLSLIVISHGHDDHFEPATVKQLAKTNIRWVIPHFLLDTAHSYGIREENIIPAYPGTPITEGPLHILPFEGKHYRPGTRNGLDELGYHISAENAPTLVFPVDTRDYAADNLPDLPPADVCFANIWLGDSNGFAEDYKDIGARFADFMLHFSDRQILFSHLYETGREDRDMWRHEHADILSAIIKEKSPKTSTLVPVLGEIIQL